MITVPAPTRPVHPVTSMTVCPLALATAHQLAGHEPRRVCPVDQWTVMVLNYPGQSWPTPRKTRKGK